MQREWVIWAAALSRRNIKQQGEAIKAVMLSRLKAPVPGLCLQHGNLSKINSNIIMEQLNSDPRHAEYHGTPPAIARW